MSLEASIPAVVAEHGQWLMAFIRGLVASSADAEDAFQEVWFRLIRAQTVFRASGARAYLVKTARSVVIDHLRRRHPLVCLDQTSEAGEEAEIADSSPGPDKAYECRASAAEVRAAVNALPFNWRQVVLMRIEGELEFREIAAQLNVPLGTVLVWMSRATVELKRKLGGAR